MNKLLLEELISQIPGKLITNLAKQNTWVYKEAHAAVSDNPSFDKASRKYVYPHYRFGLYETMLYKLALDCGCKATKEPTISPGHTYTLVKAGRILLAQSHVNAHVNTLRPSHFREQHSSANHFIRQGAFDFIPKHEKPPELFALVLHSNIIKKPSQAGILKIAVPQDDNKDYIDTFNVLEMMNLYSPSLDVEDDSSSNLVAWKKERKANGGF